MPTWYPIVIDARNDRDDGDEAMPVRNDQGEELLTTAEAARELGVSGSTIRTQIQQGRLRVERLDARTVLIPRSELERYRSESLGQRGPKARRAPTTAPRRV